MGLLDKLTKHGGTNLSLYVGASPKVNPAAT